MPENIIKQVDVNGTYYDICAMHIDSTVELPAAQLTGLDTTVSSTSTNAVENRAVYAALQEKIKCNAIDFTATEWTQEAGGTYGITFANTVTKHTTPAYIAQLQITDGSTKKVLADQMVKNSDGSLTLTGFESPFVGQVLIMTGIESTADITDIRLNGASVVSNKIANIVVSPNTGSAATATDLTTLTIGSNVYKIPEQSEVAWGKITGTLSSQTDLQNALNAKATTTDLTSGIITVKNATNAEKATKDANGNTITSTYATAANLSDVSDRVTTIEGKIPNAATSSNQLADKAFVNSSINAMAAFYITKNAAGDAFATKAELNAATEYYSGGQIRVPTKNDYCIVLADESKRDTETQTDPTTRYIYNNQWDFQYIVNKTSLTAAQLEAVNSGATKTKIDSIADKYEKPASGIPASDLAETYYLASNPNGYTSNTGTVTSVCVQAGTGLSSSQSTAQTKTLNTTIGIASGYKLPTTTEWNNKQDAIAAYLKSAAVSDNTLTLTNKDNSTVEFTPKTGRGILLSNASSIDNITVEQDETTGVSPYSTSYKYTNITIDTDKVPLTEATLTNGTIITIMLNTAVASAYRNVRVRFGESGHWLPIFGTTAILAGSSYLTVSSPRHFVFSNAVYSTADIPGAFHMMTDSNSTYSPMSLGFGYGTCSTAEATAAKVVSLSSYSLVTNGAVSVKFTYAVPANATMNINGKGAKSIYYRGAAIVAGIINAGDVAHFVYNGSQYILLGTDNLITNAQRTAWDAKQDALATQIAYSAKGSATKVPQITTNTLGQVTGITEVDITQPTVNNGTLTIQKNGTTVTTFSANQSSNVTANITVPTKVSELTNDSGYTTNKGTVTSVQVQAGTGLASSQSTAQTTTLNTTISIASGYKLPTTTEWSNKANINTGNTFTGGKQVINGAGSAVFDTPLDVRSNDTSTYIQFLDKNGTSLGYYGVKSDNKPYFYTNNDGDKQLFYEGGAYWANIPVSTTSSTTTHPKVAAMDIGDSTLEYDSTNKCITISFN